MVSVFSIDRWLKKMQVFQTHISLLICKEDKEAVHANFEKLFIFLFFKHCLKFAASQTFSQFGSCNEEFMWSVFLEFGKRRSQKLHKVLHA